MALATPLQLPWPHHHVSRCSSTVASATRVVISATPRPAVILPGLGNNTGDYAKLQVTLKEKYGVESVVAKVSRLDWFRNAAGLVDPSYWKGTLQPRPVLDWYLRRVFEAVEEAKGVGGGQGKVSLIGHSAGGWLARVYMEEFGKSGVSLLLSLGTPHNPPPEGVSGVVDQTRGLLNYVEKNCAKAVYGPELKYVCVAGRYICGARVFGGLSENSEYVGAGDVEEMLDGAAVVSVPESSLGNGTLRARFVGQGYKQVCGQADVWGDGVVPEVSAHLEGALNISLEGVYHSPVGSDDLSRPWYGSPAVVEKWIDHLLDSSDVEQCSAGVINVTQ